ncbi:MAG: hypothetical protein JO276_09765, partial [Sphingomonadaceae bacterium]|nr:hypothetical protein [Sphingomonadaceae bacterium]
DPASRDLTRVGKRRVFEAGLAGLVTAGEYTTKQLKSSADDIIQTEIDLGNLEGKIPEGLVDKYLVFDDRHFVDGLPGYYRSFPNSVDWQPFVYAYQHLDDLARVIAGLGRAYLASPTGPAAWSARQYRDEQSKIARDCESWLSTNAFLFAGQSVAPIVLALMLALDELAGGIEDPVTLTLTDQSDPTKPKAMVI